MKIVNDQVNLQRVHDEEILRPPHARAPAPAVHSVDPQSATSSQRGGKLRGEAALSTT